MAWQIKALTTHANATHAKSDNYPHSFVLCLFNNGLSLSSAWEKIMEKKQLHYHYFDSLFLSLLPPPPLYFSCSSSCSTMSIYSLIRLVLHVGRTRGFTCWFILIVVVVVAISAATFKRIFQYLNCSLRCIRHGRSGSSRTGDDGANLFYFLCKLSPLGDDIERGGWIDTQRSWSPLLAVVFFLNLILFHFEWTPA